MKRVRRDSHFENENRIQFESLSHRLDFACDARDSNTTVDVLEGILVSKRQQ